VNALLRYWPVRDEVNACIKAEAEAASEEVLLAVHQPSPLVHRQVDGSLETPATEADLLNALLTDDLPQGTLILPITGASGAGKSHLVRWLAAQLRRHPKAERMLVIRIPKSASLRTVVELILEPLAQDPHYAAARIELQRAVAEVSPDIAAVRFRTGLQIALGALGRRLMTTLRTDPQGPNASLLKRKIGHAQRLPQLFNDAALEAHYLPKVLEPIVRRAVNGGSYGEEGAKLPQFAAADLALPQGVELGQAAVAVQQYYLTVLEADGGRQREVAAGVLNDVIDEAIQEIFQIAQALGGVSLQDIILRIRELLFKEERELVLLVEDFAALAGIQDILLNVCIQEAERDGKRVRARMRTVLALTDGYLAGRDTISTRAQLEWVVQGGQLRREAALRQTLNIVAGYLNAARWGAAELRRRFQDGARTVRGEEWVGIYRDEDLTPEVAATLDAFGYASDICLFPFNEAAIRSLAERTMTVGGRLEYTPRKVINYVLRDVLLLRDAFEARAFPPPDFKGAVPDSGIAPRLARMSDERRRKRLASFLVHWGGNPTGEDGWAALPPALFKVFGLPTPEESGLSVPRDGERRRRETTDDTKDREQRPRDQKEEKKEKDRPVVALPEDPRVAEWKAILEKWVAGTRLPQARARHVRNWLATALNAAIEWNNLRLARRDVGQDMIQLPLAEGNTANAILQVASDSTDPDGRLRLALLAFARREVHRSWSYDGGDEDSAYAANLVTDLASRLADHFEREAEREVGALRELLVRQSLLLGLASRPRGANGLIEAMFVPAPDAPASAEDGTPEARILELRHKAARLRPAFQKLAFDRAGCLQGTGRKVYAVDIARIASSAGGGTEPPTDGFPPDGLVEARDHVRALAPERILVRLKPALDRLKEFRETLRGELGEDFDKAELLKALPTLLQEVEAAVVWPSGVEPKQVRATVTQLRETPLMETLRNVEALLVAVEQGDADVLLERLGRVDLQAVDTSRRCVRIIADFVAGVERAIASSARAAMNVDPASEAARLAAELDTIQGDLGTLAEVEVDA
jgi:hypothetical protein